jgi:hypothetical protein
LADALDPEGVWIIEQDVLTASRDYNIWTVVDYDNFILDLEFKNAAGTNSGVIVYCSDVDNWIPNSVEIQVADDYASQWAEAPPTWQCGAVFGHLPARKKMVRPPGEWNRFTITCQDSLIWVLLNGEQVIEMNMNHWKRADRNPDGSEIPPWLSKPLAELPTRGRIGFQGKHGGAPIYFRNIRIHVLD